MLLSMSCLFFSSPVSCIQMPHKNPCGSSSTNYICTHMQGCGELQYRLQHVGWAYQKQARHGGLALSSLFLLLLYYTFLIFAIAALIHCKENPIYIFLFWELCSLSHDSTFMCLWAIYIFPGLVNIFPWSRFCGPILEIYESLADIWA